MNYYLGIDIGASSGRHILSWISDGRIFTEEIYRFKNGTVSKNGHLCWELDRLFSEIINGIAKCRDIGKIPCSVGIDTWAVDYVLLDGKGEVIGDTYAYRDSRTDGIPEQVYALIGKEELFEKTAIQPQVFNTIFQLCSDKSLLKEAKHLLFVPEYFNYLLTGNMMTEYTVATTSGLVDAVTGSWDEEILSRLGLDSGIFGEIHMPGTTVGEFTPEIQSKVGFNARVVLPCLHDTGSAVLALPTNEDTVYISSGTWSLMGVELEKPMCGTDCLTDGFTSEGGAYKRFRFLKNIMGLWMLQSVKKELDDKYSFDELCALAEKETGYNTVIDVNDNAFLSPDSMIEAVAEYCRKQGLDAPENIGQTVKCIYISLAESYAQTVKEIENITGKRYNNINIIGGGSKDPYLNRLTAERTGKRIITGPTEATAIGNLLMQMIAGGEIADLREGREIIANSFDIKSI